MHPLLQPAASIDLEPHRTAHPELESFDLFTVAARQMRTFCGPHPDFEDLLQKAMLELHRAMPRFRGESQLSTFVYAVCYRTWTRHLRTTTRFFRRFRLTSDGSLPHEVDPHDPAELCSERERYRQLYAALEKLPPKMRAVVVMHDLDELELEEISTIIQTNIHTVRSRLRHGRRKLRTSLMRTSELRGKA